MTHVKITTGHGKRPVLEVDGKDMARHILAEGFEVDWADVSAGMPARIRMIVLADSLEVDLPDAVVEALRDEVQSDD